MTQEEKQLVLIDLCARLPYGVRVYDALNDRIYIIEWFNPLNAITSGAGFTTPIEECKPYLRPMSSMTQEEIDEYDAELDKDMDIVMSGALDKDRYITSDGKHTFSKNFVAHFDIDWLNKNMFDYRGLIPMGLALEAKEGMYK